MRLSTLFSQALNFLTSVRLLSNILSSATHESATLGLCCQAVIAQIGPNRLAIASARLACGCSSRTCSNKCVGFLDEKEKSTGKNNKEL